ncbi:Aspartate aminotransferase, cytoplasmic [Coelomomyces lativittatus]|nr:Aspartate aminotransferase, cytoplasmic [Coelomomyces lativittatus]
MPSFQLQFGSIPLAPPDAVFDLTASYIADTCPEKINVGVGAYRTDEGKPWLLPVVQKVEKELAYDMSLDHEYLPINGLKSMCESAAQLILGKDHTAILNKHYASIQSISGTGALRLGAEYLARFFKDATVYISNPTWVNHNAIFTEAGFNTILMYPYYDPKTCGLDFKGFLETIRSAAPQSIFLIHACAHNPTGVDPTQAQWKELFKALIECRHLVFFDCAYQGFATGDVDQDAWAVRTLANDTELLIAQSFAKNFGLYNERCGVLTVVTKTPAPVSSQLSQIQRAMISNPPAHGARIVSKILNSPDLYKEWLDCLKIMSQRIKDMRQKLYQSLCDMKTPGSWEHIINQIGMFCFTGLSGKYTFEYFRILAFRCTSLSLSPYFFLFSLF